jgi:hypothetical protein
MNPMQTVDNPELTREERKDLKVLALFSSVYCDAHHSESKERIDWGALGLPEAGVRYRFCAECREFLVYAAMRRLKCPLDPKPVCKHCHVHCYRPGHREKVREVMRFSGRRLIMRGRLDLLWHYFF